MLHFTRGKVIGILAVCLFGLLACLPNFLPQSVLDSWPRFLPHTRINLGLDLQGGAHVLAGMDVEELRRDWLDKIRDQDQKIAGEIEKEIVAAIESFAKTFA